jgi:hypothetical protein
MRENDFTSKSVDLSKYSEQHQRMIEVAVEFFELTLAPDRTPTAIAEQSEIVSERLWEIALAGRRPRLA